MNLYFLGDAHGKWKSFEDTITRGGIHDAAIWNLGDGTFGFNKRLEDFFIMDRLNKFCQNHNIILYNTRGNHDDPYWFKSEASMIKRLTADDNHIGDWTKNDIEYQKTYMTPEDFVSFIKNLSNVKFVKDYDTVTINDKRILSIGGAISIDRISKRRENLYFPNEQVTYNNKIRDLRNIDIIAAHIAPVFVEPFELADIVKNWAYYDKNLIQELKKERDLITKIYNDISKKNKVKYYFYGHYHRPYNNIQNDTTFICLPPIILYKLD